MADMIIDLLQNKSKRQTLSQQAYQQVKAHYDWSMLIPKLIDIYKGMGIV